jgi:hypothetical protein
MIRLRRETPEEADRRGASDPCTCHICADQGHACGGCNVELPHEQGQTCHSCWRLMYDWVWKEDDEDERE